MASPVFIYRMPLGIPGFVNRAEHALITPELVNQTNPPTAFGVFVKNTATGVSRLVGAEAATDIIGLFVRPFPVQPATLNEGLGTAVPDPTQIGNVMKRGYMTVSFGGTTATKGAQVYVRITAATNPVGSIEETADAGKCIAVQNCYFNGPADSNKNVEISYNIEH